MCPVVTSSKSIGFTLGLLSTLYLTDGQTDNINMTFYPLSANIDPCRGLKPDKIIGATNEPGDLFFLIKWQVR